MKETGFGKHYEVEPPGLDLEACRKNSSGHLSAMRGTQPPAINAPNQKSFPGSDLHGRKYSA